MCFICHCYILPFWLRVDVGAGGVFFSDLILDQSFFMRHNFDLQDRKTTTLCRIKQKNNYEATHILF